MRFVVGSYLTQNAMNDPKEPRTASRPRRRVRRPSRSWLAVLRPQNATAQRGRNAQTAEAFRSGS
jgi:hypothetical protein